MRRHLTGALAGLVLVWASSASAALFHFEGEIFYHNDVVFTTFHLDNDATDIRIWTDSFEDGVHFDPITGLWDAAGNLLEENDDNPNVGPGQDFWDSGMEIASLGAGDYTFTIASYDNFAEGSTLGDGFRYDGDNPIPISEWWSGGDGYWSLWMDGVDDAGGPGEPGEPVPEPTTFALFGLGLAGLLRRRRKNAK